MNWINLNEIELMFMYDMM